MNAIPQAPGGTELAAQIAAWTRTTFGTRCVVSDVGSLGGHSGVTIGFDVVEDGLTVERLVLKIPPPGVARKNNFDVLRQVPLLQALEANGIPAPRACYWSEDESAFGAPYLMMSRLKGASPPDLFRLEAGQRIEHVEARFDHALDVLAGIHAIDTESALADWNAGRDPDAEIEHWARVLRKTEDTAWLQLGLEVRDLLHETRPAEIPIGLVHGDYYSNNWVFDGPRLSGVVDWEGASIGPSLIDLGWVYMIYEPESWGPTRRASMAGQPAPEHLVERYAAHAAGQLTAHLTDLGWYRALAGYRIACITAYYFEEHRSGRRPNATWELFGEAFPFLMNRAAGLLRTRRG